MDKNDFDLDFDFEKEYGFDPKDFLSSDDDFDYSGFENEDVDLNELLDDEPAENEDNLAADFSGMKPAPSVQTDSEQPETEAEESSDEETAEETVESEESEEVSDAEEEYEEEEKPRKKLPGLKIPKLPANLKMPKLPKREKAEKSAGGEKKSALSKLVDIYMEPITNRLNDEEVLDPLNPRYIRRKKHEKERIFKDVYLPAIIACAAFFMIISFIIGSVSNAITVKNNQASTAKQEAIQQANAVGEAEVEYKRVMAEAERLAVEYNYEEAIALLENYQGPDKFKSQANLKRSELNTEMSQLTEIKDISGIPNLSFHVLMADAHRACDKTVSGDLAGSYNKNFVSVEEFTRILNQLYASGYVLVDFNSFIKSNTGVDGNESFFAQSIMLPQGKKPIMITETMVNYFEYMVDPDKDGKADANGHGFANKLVVENGEIKAAYVDSTGQNLVGNYDLVPVLETFIQEHPDFSYRGARAILAVTGSEGVFGYRTNTSYVSTRGQSYYDNEVSEAKKVVAALREKGYTIASYTYSNQAYRSMSTLQIQAEMQNWTNQITPVLGPVDTIVFARASDIEAYSGTTFNVLYNTGFRFFLNSGSSPRVDANTTFIRQTRLMVTGEAMAHYASQFSDYFDCNVVLDINSRGSTPTKS